MSPAYLPRDAMRVAGPINTKEEARMLEQALLLFEIKTRLGLSPSRR